VYRVAPRALRLRKTPWLWCDGSARKRVSRVNRLSVGRCESVRQQARAPSVFRDAAAAQEYLERVITIRLNGQRRLTPSRSQPG